MFRLFSGSHSLGWSVLLKLTLFLVLNSSCLFSNLLSPVPRITYAGSNIVPSAQTTSALSFSQPQPFTSLVLLPAPPPSSTPPTTYHIIINSSFIPFSCVCLCFWVRKKTLNITILLQTAAHTALNISWKVIPRTSVWLHNEWWHSGIQGIEDIYMG